jgi:hypothetical protein
MKKALVLIAVALTLTIGTPMCAFLNSSSNLVPSHLPLGDGRGEMVDIVADINSPRRIIVQLSDQTNNIGICSVA